MRVVDRKQRGNKMAGGLRNRGAPERPQTAPSERTNQRAALEGRPSVGAVDVCYEGAVGALNAVVHPLGLTPVGRILMDSGLAAAKSLRYRNPTESLYRQVLSSATRAAAQSYTAGWVGDLVSGGMGVPTSSAAVVAAASAQGAAVSAARTATGLILDTSLHGKTHTFGEAGVAIATAAATGAVCGAVLSGVVELNNLYNPTTEEMFQKTLEEGHYTEAAGAHDRLCEEASDRTLDAYNKYCSSTAYQPDPLMKDHHVGGQPFFEKSYSTLYEKLQSEGSISFEDVVAANKELIRRDPCLRGSLKCHNIGAMASLSPAVCPERPQFIPVSPEEAELLKSNPLLTYTTQTCSKPLTEELPEGHTLAHVWFASPYHVHTLLKSWVAKFNKAIKSGPDGLLRLLELEAEFIAIHPFTDGNGRTARMLMALAKRVIGLPCVPSMRQTLRVTQPERVKHYTEGAANTYQALRKSVADDIEEGISPRTTTATTVKELLPAIAPLGNAAGLRRRHPQPTIPQAKRRESKKTV